MPIAAHAKTVRNMLTALAAVAATAAALTACDAQSGPTLEPGADSRQVTVVGAGQVQGTPDTLTVNASMEFVGPDATAAMNQTNERQQAVIDGLVELGIDRKDIATTAADLQPQYNSDSTSITAYRATNSVNVTLRDLGRASDAIGLIVATGGNATRINSISYSIEDDSQLVRDARARAFEDAKDRAAQYAELSGLNLGKVISISESGGPTPPVPMQAPRAMEAAVPLEPGQQTVGFSVTVIWELT
ncbi:SIMPL domain-containing protein [Mycolicibacterium austroafricanum]|uniref:SIMPL domain-containing protein n=1 Tax=Mycolicibacterium austroafricanum TaxID=39687 RepID=UPI001CA3803C|nr:SIMPL domain-containing protein [Mycolicibacterium austroafricanum]QZT62411.1 SIMPL domain-containing protein [Mycolicibacterium austroafricanum]